MSIDDILVKERKRLLKILENMAFSYDFFNTRFDASDLKKIVDEIAIIEKELN